LINIILFLKTIIFTLHNKYYFNKKVQMLSSHRASNPLVFQVA